MPEQTSSSSNKVVKTAAAGGAVLSLGAALVGVADPAAAANFEVTNNTDSDPGSLRDAIDDANSTAGPDTITFAAGLGTIELTSQIEITEDLTITGPATISGGDATRIFYITDAGDVTLSGLTLLDGEAEGPSDDGNGGAVHSRDTNLTLQQSSITGSAAIGTDGGGYGGGLFVYYGDEINIVDTNISDNTATASGGGASFYADGHDGVVNISGSTFDGNTAEAYGGGIQQIHFYELHIDTTTISNNTAGYSGGGVYFHADDEATEFTLTSSTVSGNHSLGEGEGDGYGGGVDIDNVYTAVIAHSTIVGNDTTGSGGGVFFSDVDVPTLDHVLLGNNTADGVPEGSDIDAIADGAPVPSATSFSSFEVTPLDGILDDIAGNLFDEDPGVGALADNGGPNMTHALAATSVALDGGDPAFAPPPTTDQRGESRVEGEAIDIGAYEAQPEEPTPPPAAQPAAAAPTFTG